MGHKICVGDSCIGIGQCESIAPEVFVVGDGGFAEVRATVHDAEQWAAVREAADSCPTASIEILED